MAENKRKIEVEDLKKEEDGGENEQNSLKNQENLAICEQNEDEENQNLSKKELKKLQKLEKKTQKQKEKEEKYLEKFGIPYAKIYNSLPSNERKKRLENNPEKAKISKSHFKIFLKCFTKHKFMLSVVILISLINIGISFALLPFIQTVIDMVLIGEWTQAILNCLIILGLTFALYVNNTIQSIVFGKLSGSAVAELRHNLAVKALNTESRSYKTLSSGEVVYRVSSEPNDFATSIREIYDNTVEILTITGYFLYFALTNYLLAVCMVVVLLISFILLRVQLKKRNLLQRRNKILNEKMNSYVNEFVRGADDVKSLNLKNIVLKTCDKWIKCRKNSYIDMCVYQNTMTTVRMTIEEVLIVATLILSIYLACVGFIPVSVFLLFFYYRKTPTQLTKFISNVLASIQDSKISSDRMGKLYDETVYAQEKFGEKELSNFKGNIELKNVTFSFGEQKVLNDVSFKVPAKHSLGIVGKSGEGKSTILGLIESLYDFDSGEILLDGVNNKELSEQALRGNVSLVPQSPYIFNTTIRENLRFAKADATEDEMIEVLKKAQFYDFVMSKPEGLDTIVGEGGVILSGGQRQRLAVARAFLTESKVIMLDEATSALDNKNQEGIKDVINEMKKNCSFIIVAHRLSTIVDCDEIIVIDGHKIVARGKHEDLIKTCSIYSDLYKLEKQQSENI